MKRFQLFSCSRLQARTSANLCGWVKIFLCFQIWFLMAILIFISLASATGNAIWKNQHKNNWYLADDGESWSNPRLMTVDVQQKDWKSSAKHWSWPNGFDKQQFIFCIKCTKTYSLLLCGDGESFLGLSKTSVNNEAATLIDLSKYFAPFLSSLWANKRPLTLYPTVEMCAVLMVSRSVLKLCAQVKVREDFSWPCSPSSSCTTTSCRYRSWSH